MKPRRAIELEKIIRAGCLFEKAGFDTEREFDIEDWYALGQYLEGKLRGEYKDLDSSSNSTEKGTEAIHSMDTRIYQYYLPVYFWMEDMVKREKAAKHEKKRLDADFYEEGAILIGLSCPQGGGKTTVTRFLKNLFAERGMKCIVASLDDYYYSYQDQQRIAKQHEGNDLLEFRGSPGTHDTELLRSTLECLSGGTCCLVPRYNKSAFGGRGDLFEQEKWLDAGVVDVVLLEGWCLGFEAVSEEELERYGDPRLRDVNNHLKEYDFLKEMLTAMVVIEVGDVSWVYDWREEAEMARRKRGDDGALSEKELEDFVNRFMPSYELYLPDLYKHEYCPGKELRLQIDRQRRPVK